MKRSSRLLRRSSSRGRRGLILEKSAPTEERRRPGRSVPNNFVYSKNVEKEDNREAIRRIREEMADNPLEEDLAEVNKDLKVVQSTVSGRRGDNGRRQESRQAGVNSKEVGVLTVGVAVLIGGSAYAYYSSTS